MAHSLYHGHHLGTHILDLIVGFNVLICHTTFIRSLHADIHTVLTLRHCHKDHMCMCAL